MINICLSLFKTGFQTTNENEKTKIKIKTKNWLSTQFVGQSISAIIVGSSFVLFAVQSQKKIKQKQKQKQKQKIDSVGTHSKIWNLLFITLERNCLGNLIYSLKEIDRRQKLTLKCFSFVILNWKTGWKEDAINPIIVIAVL